MGTLFSRLRNIRSSSSNIMMARHECDEKALATAEEGEATIRSPSRENSNRRGPIARAAFWCLDPFRIVILVLIAHYIISFAVIIFVVRNMGSPFDGTTHPNASSPTADPLECPQVRALPSDRQGCIALCTSSLLTSEDLAQAMSKPPRVVMINGTYLDKRRSLPMLDHSVPKGQQAKEVYQYVRQQIHNIAYPGDSIKPTLQAVIRSLDDVTSVPDDMESWQEWYSNSTSTLLGVLSDLKRQHEARLQSALLDKYDYIRETYRDSPEHHAEDDVIPFPFNFNGHPSSLSTTFQNANGNLLSEQQLKVATSTVDTIREVHNEEADADGGDKKKEGSIWTAWRLLRNAPKVRFGEKVLGEEHTAPDTQSGPMERGVMNIAPQEGNPDWKPAMEQQMPRLPVGPAVPDVLPPLEEYEERRKVKVGVDYDHRRPHSASGRFRKRDAEVMMDQPAMLAGAASMTDNLLVKQVVGNGIRGGYRGREPIKVSDFVLAPAPREDGTIAKALPGSKELDGMLFDEGEEADEGDLSLSLNEKNLKAASQSHAYDCAHSPAVPTIAPSLTTTLDQEEIELTDYPTKTLRTREITRPTQGLKARSNDALRAAGPPFRNRKDKTLPQYDPPRQKRPFFNPENQRASYIKGSNKPQQRPVEDHVSNPMPKGFFQGRPVHKSSGIRLSPTPTSTPSSSSTE
ncbi:hypothetical protein QBC42DRAFT_284241 [Cladorrhinum samala]|uniref:Uncharacterized protein n=1 Tax=Cladorrhinum samala TaxID=585594 RepID=A0AAV9HX16_9PEZI|nr:hypothetical protein QBC42DRAFT_284241 [Cladorrhinum samala]